jgi:integrase/recombinase XerD
LRFLLATDDLVVHKRNFAGFPLLLRDDCNPMEPAQTYLWHLLSKAGRIESKKTWEKYGRDLYDFFAFIETNHIDWRTQPENGLPGPIDMYIQWSKGKLGLNSNTINSRVRFVTRFYKWAHQQGHVKQLPFNEVSVTNVERLSFLTHVEENPKTVKSLNILLKGSEPVIDLLNIKQISQCLESINNDTHRLIFELIIRTGLRQEEVRTLPESYIFDPSQRRDLNTGQMLMMKLNPNEIKTKGNKERIIEIPYSLMEDLWWWSVSKRPRRAALNTSGKIPSCLFLTQSGNAYGDSAFTSIFNRLSGKVGFPVRPHMGRHTYATHRLMSLKNSKTFYGDPLLYVMDRLGHSSVTTTARYLKYINMLSGQLLPQHEDEVDKLFAKED